MKLLYSFTIITALTVSKCFATDSPEVVISELGSVVGIIDETSWTNQTFYSYRGIPYAESPSGELRFQPPKSRAPWKTTFDARDYGKLCPDLRTLVTFNESQLLEDLEDCLSINVFTKNLEAKRPVMVYIHGGGFIGSNAEQYKPHYLLEKDIVLVVPQYRVGALGFMTTLTKEMPGNVPVMDLQLALEWVQKYINLFGGDPTKVTLFGQSAGAGLLTTIVVSPRTSAEYFKRTIVASGSVLAPWCINRTPVEQVKRICDALGCDKCNSKDEMYAFLKNVPTYEFVKLERMEKFSPVIGDVYGVVPKEPLTLLENLNRTIPLMTGFMKHDGSFLMKESFDAVVGQYGSFSNVTVRQYANALIDDGKDYTGLARNLLLDDLFKYEILDFYNHKDAWPAYFDISSDVNFKSPVIAYANAMQRKGNPVYMYAFDYMGQYTEFNKDLNSDNSSRYPFHDGVGHSSDNIYLFNKYPLEANDAAFARKMVNLWYTFAVDGEPKIVDQPELIIKPMQSESGPYFHLNKNITFGGDILMELTATTDDPENYKLVDSMKSGVGRLFNNDSAKYCVLILLSISIFIRTFVL